MIKTLQESLGTLQNNFGANIRHKKQLLVWLVFYIFHNMQFQHYKFFSSVLQYHNLLNIPGSLLYLFFHEDTLLLFLIGRHFEWKFFELNLFCTRVLGINELLLIYSCWFIFRRFCKSRKNIGDGCKIDQFGKIGLDLINYIFFEFGRRVRLMDENQEFLLLCWFLLRWWMWYFIIGLFWVNW